MSSGLRDGPPLTPKRGEPSVAASILTKSMRPPERIPAGTAVTSSAKGCLGGEKLIRDEDEARMCQLVGMPLIPYILALGCCCSSFESNFLCAACDRRWEEHETFFETEETRRRGGRPYGEGTTQGRGPCQHLSSEGQAERHAHPPPIPSRPPTPHIPCLHCFPSPGADYVPFAEMPALQDAILTNSELEALQMQGVSGHSSSYPSSLELPGPSTLQPDPKSDPHT